MCDLCVARRPAIVSYRSVPDEHLSFDLLNEPPFMRDHSRYVQIARVLIEVLRAESPQRVIVVDGADIGQTPVLGLCDLKVVQGTRGYLPKMATHHEATWVPEAEFESFAGPEWPMVDARGTFWDRARLRRELLDTWQPLVAQGTPVHVGEWGCHNRTPHDVTLRWMRDVLALWQDAGCGWCLWNLRGSFGVVDSGRPDVAYEHFRGHQLDRQMLDLLRS